MGTPLLVPVPRKVIESAGQVTTEFKEIDAKQ
jgi:hypothetical protein